MTQLSREIPAPLVHGAQEGDREALRELVEAAYPLVRRWALIRTGDPSDADDLTQDVLVQVIRKLGSYEGSARFTTWLYTITRNAAADRFRKRGRRERATEHPRTAAMLTPEATDDPVDAVERRQLGEIVRAFFEELPDRQREVFDLAELQGLSSTEIAELTGIEPVSVRASLFKARRTIRRRILEAHPQLAEDLS